MRIENMRELFNNQGYINEYKFYKPNQEHLRMILETLREKKKILVLGCGSGREIEILSKKNMIIDVIEISENMIIESKKVSNKPNYMLGDVVDIIQHIKGRYDYVIGLFGFFSCITPRERREMLITEIERVLKSGGMFILGYEDNNGVKKRIKEFLAIMSKDIDLQVGDVYNKNPYDENKKHKSHQFAKQELKDFFNKYPKFNVDYMQKHIFGTKI